MADERIQELKKKLRRIEALHAGAKTEGERTAAAAARGRILERLGELSTREPAIEHRFVFGDVWTEKLLLALCRRYGLEPFRYEGEELTLSVEAPRRFVRETLWPEYRDMSIALTEMFRIDEAMLKDRLDRIETATAATTTTITNLTRAKAPGSARPRPPLESILQQLGDLRQRDPEEAREIALPDLWSVKLLEALCRRYELKPLWYETDTAFALKLRAPPGFLTRLLEPVFKSLHRELRRYLTEITQRVIAEALHEDLSDATCRPGRRLDVRALLMPGM